MKNKINKKRLQNLSCAFAQIAIKDFANSKNFPRKFLACSFSGENFA